MDLFFINVAVLSSYPEDYKEFEIFWLH